MSLIYNGFLSFFTLLIRLSWVRPPHIPPDFLSQKTKACYFKRSRLFVFQALANHCCKHTQQHPGACMPPETFQTSNQFAKSQQAVLQSVQTVNLSTDQGQSLSELHPFPAPADGVLIHGTAVPASMGWV